MPVDPALSEGTDPASSRPASLIGARGRVLLQTGAWSMVARLCGAANLFVCVPFVLDALGTARFGVWATLCALPALAGFLDFGFGNGAMNLVASARGRGADDEVPLIYAAALRAVAGAVAWAGAVAMLAWLLLPWDRLLGLGPEFAAQCRWSAGIVIVATLVAVPLSLATRIQLGLGRGERAFRWQAFASLLTLATVVLLARSGASLPALTAAAVGVPLLGLGLATLELRREARRPVPDMAGDRLPQLMRDVRRSGVQFFLLQLSAVLSFSLDLPLLTALTGPTSAADYAIVQRLFSIVPMGLSLLWVPLWPLYRNALAAGDHAWAGRTFRRSLALATALAVVAGIVLVLGFEPVSTSWVGHPVPASLLVLLGFAVWCVADAAGGAVTTYLNAAGIMRPQLAVAAAFVLLCLPLKAWAASVHGADAVIWVTAGLCIVLNLLPLFLFRQRLAAAARNRTH